MGLGSVGKLRRRPESERFFRLAKTAKQAMLVLSSIQPDAARRKKSRSKPDRVLRQSPCQSHPPAIECRAFSFSYAEGAALQEISFTVRRGEFVTIVGPNGSGKSTLLKCLNRILVGDQHRVHIAGRPLADYSQRELAKTLSYVPQAGHATPMFTAYEFVMMGRYPHRGPYSSVTADDDRVVLAALEKTESLAWADRPLDTLSGGECQRVYIAAALTQGANILLLDEPTTSLDPKRQVEIYRLLKQLNREGITILLVTHDVNAAAQFGTSLLGLREGRIAYWGPAAEFLEVQHLKALYDTTFHIIDAPTQGGRLALQDMAS